MNSLLRYAANRYIKSGLGAERQHLIRVVGARKKVRDMARRNRKEDLDEITRALGQNDSEYSAPLGSDGPVSLLALLLGALVLALVLAGYLVFFH